MRDPRIEAIAKELCTDCRHRLEEKMGKIKHPERKSAQARMALFAMRSLCANCKNKLLQGVAGVYGR